MRGAAPAGGTVSLVELRPATRDDAPDLRELVRAAYAKYVARMGAEPRPMTEDYAEVVERLDVTVAEDDGAIVGLIALDGDSDEGFLIDNVAVTPERHGTGVGRMLLELAERKARERGVAELALYTHSTMSENIALYTRIGYVEYDRRPSPPGELVFLRKSLPAG